MSKACAPHHTVFRNDDWTVSDQGLEHRGTGYFIDRAILGARRAENLWDWPLQMAEKRWCRPSLFREAFLAAVERFGLARDAELTASFALGFGIRAAGAPVDPGFVALADLLRGKLVAATIPTPASRRRAGAGIRRTRSRGAPKMDREARRVI